MHDDLHRPLFVPDLLANALNQQPGRPLLQLLGGAMLSVGDVRDAASRYQQALASFGVGKGSRVGMLRSEEHTSELQSLMRISYAVFCLKKQINVSDSIAQLPPH